MKLKDLFEGISPIVYHATSSQALLDIIKQNKFNLTPTFTKGADNLNDGYKYYLSTARTRTARYHLDNRHNTVLIELDGRKLSYNHAGEPLDYWGEDFRKYSKDYEQEDRVYSNKNEIKNAMTYINNIDILVGNVGGNVAKGIVKIIKELKRANIPYRLYENNRDFISGSRNYLTLEELIGKSKQDDIQRYSRKREHDPSISALFKGLRFNDLKNFTPKEEKALSNFIFSFDGLSILNAVLHNATNSNEDRNLVYEISKEMRKHKLFSSKDILTYLDTKWREILR